jgi:2-C-methyl-D-erythritol 4-phosphate cytidylyltransferase
MRANGRATRKPFVELAGRTVLEHTCAAFHRAKRILELVLVAHPDDVETLQRMCADVPELSKVRVVVAGGEERADSVRIGVRWTSFAVDVIVVHDAARPLVEPACIDRAVEVAAAKGAALVAVPVTDTIKTSSDRTTVDGTLDRSLLWSAQTPQAFRAASLRELVARAAREGFRPTDDSALYERYVGPVPIVEGSADNLKLTRPEDIPIAEALLRARKNGGAR